MKMSLLIWVLIYHRTAGLLIKAGNTATDLIKKAGGAGGGSSKTRGKTSDTANTTGESFFMKMSKL